MKYYSCKFINNSLCFNDSRIVYCTVGNFNNRKKFALLKNNYNGEQIDWDKLLDKIEADKESHRNGKIIESCKNCLMLANRDWDCEKLKSERKFKHVLFSNWNMCNSACIYCKSDGQDYLIKNIKANSKIIENDTYNIIPIIKDLINKNLLTEDAVIDFAGGEPTMYYKFNEALQLLIDADIKILINTNAIIYSKEIEMAVKKGLADVVISLDAGTRKIHEKVKRVASYKAVINNLKKYCGALSKENKNKVITKFIIVPGVNDSKKEIFEWIKLSKNIGIFHIYFNADDRLFKNSECNLEHMQTVKELTDYFIKTANLFNLKYDTFSNANNAYTKLGLDLPVYRNYIK